MCSQSIQVGQKQDRQYTHYVRTEFGNATGCNFEVWHNVILFIFPLMTTSNILNQLKIQIYISNSSAPPPFLPSDVVPPPNILSPPLSLPPSQTIKLLAPKPILITSPLSPSPSQTKLQMWWLSLCWKEAQAIFTSSIVTSFPS